MQRYRSRPATDRTGVVDSVRVQLTRQVAHWSRAAGRLEALENLAAPGAWAELERYLGVAVRDSLRKPIERLQRQAIALRAALDAARTAGELERVRRHLVDFRKRYLRTETMVDFFADAVNTRTNPELAAVLRSCDELARRSLVELLDQLGRPAPPVLTYIDKGLGASILKAGLRLWDGSTENPAAAIKIVHHNMQRPTALIHEAGHQMAHILGWNEELAAALEGGLGSASPELAKMWASWSSEIAADAFAFVHTGYASVAGLHDVLAGDDAFVFRYTEFDPHPISYIRVLLGVEMCRQFYGPGPWDDLALAWQHSYPLAKAEAEVRTSLSRSILLLGQVVALTLQKPAQAFKGRALTELIDPQRVGPQALQRLERQIGPALYTSPHWVWAEPLRLLALTGYRAATRPEQAGQAMVQQEQWMKKLGRALKAA